MQAFSSHVSVVVHAPEHVQAAFAAARRLGLSTLSLWSAAGAPSYQGTAWLPEVIQIVARDFPEIRATLTLDCGDAAGLALAALQGLADIVALPDAPATVKAKVADIALKAQREFVSSRPEQANRVDLLDDRDPFARCLEALARSM